MEMRENRLVKESEAFALRVIKLYKYLKGRGETVLSKQVLRSGTSIGANIAEAQYAQSKDDFISKMSIALKECSETKYWVRLLTVSGFLPATDASVSLSTECETLLSL